MPYGLLKARQCAAVVERALEQLHADDAKDEKDEAAQHQHVAHLWHHRKDPLHQHRHAGDTLERSQWPERAKGTKDGVVAHRREDDGKPCKRDDHKVELAPRIVQVGRLVHEEAVGEDL